ncbi:ribonuclease P protein subunit p40-like [Branchiostoma floridae x Branchiostoma japonicum]
MSLTLKIDVRPPRSKLVIEKSSFDDEKSRHRKNVEEHHFNHMVELFIPGCAELPPGVQAEFDRCDDYYLIKNVPLTELINKDFIENFVKKGSLYMLSHNTHIDKHNAYAVLPTGQLLLSVHKDTYEELGLVGQPSQFNRKVKRKFVVEVDLTQDIFVPGKKNYERVKQGFQRTELKADFLISWKPEGTRQLAGSILSHFQGSYECEKHSQAQQTSRHTDLLLPVVHSTELEEGEDGQWCSAREWYEWLGAVSCGISCNEAPEHYISRYSCPDPNELTAATVRHSMTGFIAPGNVCSLQEVVRSYMRDNKSTCPWAALTVHGFVDSPVSWARREHGFHHGGENLYTFLIFRDSTYWLFQAVGTNDICP